MKIKACLIFLVLFPSLGHAQWYPQILGQNSALSTIYFVDENIGYTAGVYKIFKTTDGGDTWTLLSNSGIYESIFFVDANFGFAVGDGRILKTIDGGASWTNTWTGGLSSHFYAVTFVNNSTGFIVGYPDLILKTTDSGQNWNTLNCPQKNRRLFDVDFFSPTTGFVVADSGILYKTTDGGNSWTEQVFTAKITHAHFPSNSVGYIVGYNGYLIKTINGGSTWSTIYMGMTDITSVFFTNVDEGYAVSAWGKIYKTISGGNGWVEQDNNATERLDDVFFVNASIGYVCGFGVLKTTNGGEGEINQGNNKSSVDVYPNPATTHITLQLPPQFKQAVIIEVFDRIGRLVLRMDYSAEMDVSLLPSGLYFMVVSNEEGERVTGRFVRE